MAMTSASLKTRIKGALVTAGFIFDPAKPGNAMREDFLTAICDGIIAEIHTNAVVTHTGTVVGTSPSGPVTGTESGTGTVA